MTEWHHTLHDEYLLKSYNWPRGQISWVRLPRETYTTLLYFTLIHSGDKSGETLSSKKAQWRQINQSAKFCGWHILVHWYIYWWYTSTLVHIVGTLVHIVGTLLHIGGTLVHFNAYWYTTFHRKPKLFFVLYSSFQTRHGYHKYTLIYNLTYYL